MIPNNGNRFSEKITPTKRALLVGACAEPGAVTSRSAASSGISRISRSRRLRPPGGVRLALVFDRAAHLVGASEAVDVAAVVGEPRERIGEILERVGDHMDDARFRLHDAADRDIARAQHDRAHALEHFRPDDDVGDRAFVLDGHEHHALGRARPLPAGDQAGNRHAGVVGHAAQRLVAQDAAGVEIGAQELRRMRAQRQAQEAVVVDHFLAQRHGRKRDVGFARSQCAPPPRRHRRQTTADRRRGRRRGRAPSPPTAPRAG